MTMKRDDHIKVYVNQKEREMIERQADEDNRSVSSFIRNKIKEEIPAQVEA